MGAVITAIVLVGWQGSAMVEAWRGLLKSALEMSVGDVLEPGSSILFITRWETVRWMAPAMLAAFGIATAVSVAQGGFIFAPEAMAPKFEKFNPATKLQQMFSITSSKRIVEVAAAGRLHRLSGNLFVPQSLVRSGAGFQSAARIDRTSRDCR